MIERLLIHRNRYHDSARLMRLSQELRRLPGVIMAEVLMGTSMNCELLGASGFDPEVLRDVSPLDLVVALRGESAEHLESASAELERLLESADSTGEGGGDASLARDLEQAMESRPEINLVTVAVPGAYAAYVARQALDAGRHVFLFSDNVAVEDEVALKRQAADAGLLMMGPDCGTAILAGVGLGFANRVRRGAVGLVGASGTGIQELSCLVHRAGQGISQAIGTGSRDLSSSVGGIMTEQGLRLLAEDDGTQVILLVAKKPAQEVASRLHSVLVQLGKPVVVRYLGQAGASRRDGVTYSGDLDQAAQAALACLSGEPPKDFLEPQPPSPPEPGSGLLVGLFGGGSLASEAALILAAAGHETSAPAEPLREDRPIPGNCHLVVDLGDDAYTVGKPHPMVDQTTRCGILRAAGADPRVGLLLLDLVLGDGAHSDPAPELASAIEAARKERAGRPLAVIASVTGTDLDPQGAGRQKAALEAAGVRVAPSAATAARLAAAWLDAAQGRSAP